MDTDNKLDQFYLSPPDYIDPDKIGYSKHEYEYETNQFQTDKIISKEEINIIKVHGKKKTCNNKKLF